ncbi:hypothetical protein ACVRZD_01540 [Streptococcus hongkongensis]
MKNESIHEMVNDVSKNEKYALLNVQEGLDSKMTFDQRSADQVAHFGGAWTFIILFMTFMAIGCFLMTFTHSDWLLTVIHLSS